jgi:signal transduction histidine kinase
MQLFDLMGENHVEFDKTNVREFKILNDVLKTMTEKIAFDYRNLKEFSENAAHEMQTPLSIIQSKLELLIQSENLNAKQMEDVQAVYESATRLSKLTQALLLLAKIENNQFTELQPIKIEELIKTKINLFKELAKHKSISVEMELKSLVIKMHPMLADILVSNLIANAIKHNIEGGNLSIELNREGFVIRNSGTPLNVSPQVLFQRFRKANPASDSLGLGLAIVKAICTVYGFSLEYKYIDNLHIISIKLRNPESLQNDIL